MLAKNVNLYMLRGMEIREIQADKGIFKENKNHGKDLDWRIGCTVGVMHVSKTKVIHFLTSVP